MNEHISLSDAQIENGWRETFSTNNPYCPCDLKTFTKAARWAIRETSAAMIRAQSEALTTAQRRIEELSDRLTKMKQVLLDARETWMKENPCEDGCDHVTPFDQYLYKDV